MGNITIKISEDLSLWTKRVFVNNEYYGKFRSNITTIDKDQDFDNLKIRVEMFWGYYSSEINIPKSENKSYVIFLEDKLSRLYRIAMVIVICFTLIDAITFHLLNFFFSFPLPTLLLCGTLLVFLIDLIKRKKRFSISIHTIE